MAQGFISDEDIQRVRDANDIVAVIGERSPVRQRGRDFWCCCPIHNEKTPSLKIDPAMQLWHCFGCGEGGDVFGFIMKTEDMSFPEAVRKLADRAHIDIVEAGGRAGATSSHKARLKEICQKTADFYHTQLMRNPSAQAAQARSYLAGRKLGGEVPKRWTLGFAPGRGALTRYLLGEGYKADELVEANVASRTRDGKVRDRFYDRVMFPIFDVQGDCIAFGGRVIGKGEPKYLNSQETPIFHKSQVLYGLDKAKAAMASTGVAVVVEGYTDVIAMHEHGLKNAVATLGTALTLRHIRVLGRHAQHKIVYLFDGDAAGQRAADRALAFIDASMTPEAGKSKIELCAVTLPDNLDPADFIDQRGVDALRTCIDAAVPLVQYGIERRLAVHDLSKAEGRTRALSEALAVLAPIKDSLLAKDYAVQIAGRVRAREQDVLDQLARLQVPKQQFGEDERSGHVIPAPAANCEQAYAQRRQDSGFAQEIGRSAPSSRLSQAEVSRRRFEAEFLRLMAGQPLLALEYANSLAQIQWHDSVHDSLSAAMLNALIGDPAINASALAAKLAADVSGASRVLALESSFADRDPAQVAAYLSEELLLGDAEDVLAQMRAQLSNPQSMPADEYEMLFQSVIGMQKDLAQRRLAHKPLH